MCLAGARNGSRGFTLIELMIVLAVMTTLLAVGLPTFRAFVQDQRLRTTSTDLRIALMTARSEAVKRNRTVEVQPGPDGWGGGWTIPNPDGGDAILNHSQPGDIDITGPTEVQFLPNGRTPALAAFEIDVGVGPGQSVGCLTLGLDGRTASTKEACP